MNLPSCGRVQVVTDTVESGVGWCMLFLVVIVLVVVQGCVDTGRKTFFYQQ